ncbi:MAG: single-stranded-DNA-specific exonuclease RecJ [Marinilabiliaceae bacterium]|jgi:single-stranded-DNA-specific exonuclease|nr:single-stranded-DNA-specific exonuclease RecJ [Marinilabiliaceae bacterium]
MGKKNWVIKEKSDSVVVKQLMSVLEVGEPLANLMAQRNIKSYEDAKAFFQPGFDALHDPFLMKGMNIAVDRISSAIDKNEKILIYGDYDVDGTTSVALLYSFLKQFHGNLDYYIPNRDKEGYGVSKLGLDYARENNCSLVITIDCGIKAVDKVRYANSLGLDVIICDHHLPGDEVPDALAVLDPKQEGCAYPYKELSGCGVGFKLIHAYSRVNGIDFDDLIPYLDLVAISIASDIVPLTGENRVLAYYGLKQLNENPRIGISEIIKSSEIRKEITIEDVVFKIGPRINAAGRMESGSRAVDLLVSQNRTFAQEISKEIDGCNKHRRSVDRNITTEALRMISTDPRQANSRTTVLYNPDWHKGVIGIVASRLIETHYRPTVILTESNGFATGSARSVVGYDLYQAIESCSPLLESFGGHMFAAGLTMKKENIPAFIDRFEEYVSGTITSEQMVPKVDIDMELKFSDIDDKFYNILQKFQPFGPENMAPVFMTRRVFDTGSGRVVGSSGEHLKLDLCSEDTGTNSLPAIAFGLGNKYDLVSSGGPVDVAYSVEMNEFKGSRNLQLNIRDIRKSAP